MRNSNPEIQVNRRYALARFGLASVGFAAALPIISCGGQLDRVGLAMEATATAAVTTPTPKPPTFHEQMLQRLQTGSKIEIWEGTFKFTNSVNRRYSTTVPAKESTSGEGWSCECRPGPVYNPSWGRNEVVINPLRVSGILNDRVMGKILSQPIDGFAYIAPELGGFVWVALVTGDTDGLIERDGLRMENIRPIHLDKIKQTATIEQVKTDAGRPLVTARMESGQVAQIMNSRLSKIFWVF